MGGPAIIFDRYQESGKTNILAISVFYEMLPTIVAGVTTIRHSETGKICKKVFGLDANALYLCKCTLDSSQITV